MQPERLLGTLGADTWLEFARRPIEHRLRVEQDELVLVGQRHEQLAATLGPPLRGQVSGARARVDGVNLYRVRRRFRSSAACAVNLVPGRWIDDDRDVARC